MAAVIDPFMHQQLLERRSRLERASQQRADASRLRHLLEEVDAALARMEDGSYGICEYCHEPVETDRLIADPLVRLCLDHLSSEERSALERDLELAAQVQKGLLPSRDLQRGGWRVAYDYEPAGVVSGDYCDVVDGGDAGLYFMVGDVSGKGVAASMLMAHLHAMFRTLISVGIPLKCMLEHASRVFAESTLPTQYATLVCGRALPNGRIEISNAGHPHPLILREGQVAALETSDLPVGIFSDSEFRVAELCLEPSQSLLIYSDGVPEAMDGSGEEYGVERLRQLIAGLNTSDPAALVARCREDLGKFRGSSRADDVTLLALSRG